MISVGVARFATTLRIRPKTYDMSVSRAMSLDVWERAMRVISCCRAKLEGHQ